MMRAARLESIAQVVILLIMGGTAGAASFTHIHDLTVANGQPGWIGWANAVVVELMSIASGLELRRRKRTGQPTRFVYAVLFAAVVVSLAAQVARAKPSVWGWIVAALPALAFLAIVKIVLTRTSIMSGPVRAEVVSGPDQTAAGEAGPVETVDRCADLDLGPVDSRDRSTELDGRTRSVAPANSSLVEQIRSETTDGLEEAERRNVDRTVEGLIVPAQRINGSDDGHTQAGTAEDESLGSRSGPHGTRASSVRDRSDVEASSSDRRSDSDLPGLDRKGPDDDLLELGKTIATVVAMWKETLTRKLLIDEIRRAGGTIGTDRATKLLQLIKKAEAASVGAD